MIPFELLCDLVSMNSYMMPRDETLMHSSGFSIIVDSCQTRCIARVAVLEPELCIPSSRSVLQYHLFYAEDHLFYAEDHDEYSCCDLDFHQFDEETTDILAC